MSSSAYYLFSGDVQSAGQVNCSPHHTWAARTQSELLHRGCNREVTRNLVFLLIQGLYKAQMFHVSEKQFKKSYHQVLVKILLVRFSL